MKGHLRVAFFYRESANFTRKGMIFIFRDNSLDLNLY